MHKGDVTINGMELISGKLYEVLRGSKFTDWDEGLEGNWNGR